MTPTDQVSTLFEFGVTFLSFMTLMAIEARQLYLLGRKSVNGVVIMQKLFRDSVNAIGNLDKFATMEVGETLVTVGTCIQLSENINAMAVMGVTSYAKIKHLELHIYKNYDENIMRVQYILCGVSSKSYNADLTHPVSQYYRRGGKEDAYHASEALSCSTAYPEDFDGDITALKLFNSLNMHIVGNLAPCTAPLNGRAGRVRLMRGFLPMTSAMQVVQDWKLLRPARPSRASKKPLITTNQGTCSPL
jgi:hypothetical protein